MIVDRVLNYFFVFALLCFEVHFSFAQKEASNWYFGYNAGLSFPSNGPPIALLDGQCNTREGVATISDSSGNLLFYTDGITVWNKNHLIMANGTGLMGNESSTQSAIIVPKPTDPNIYYIFTSDGWGGGNGVRFSEVDMTGGLGIITANKNIPLVTPASERIAAFMGCNKKIWVVTVDDKNFYSFSVDSAGVNETPVISNSTVIIPGDIGQLKFSQDGKKIGLANYTLFSPSPNLTLFDFDYVTGEVLNGLVLADGFTTYGCEFSPDGSRFYAGAFDLGKIYQWNLNAGNNSAIVASRVEIVSFSNTLESLGSMQLGPDGKIYVTREGVFIGTTFLSVIKNPNALGTACSFSLNSVSLSGKSCGLGLPNFVSVPPPALASFTADPDSGVAPLTTSFTNNSSGATNYSWNFGNGNTSDSINPVTIYQHPGTYTVSLIVSNAAGCTDESYYTIYTIAPPTAGIPNIFTPNGDGVNDVFEINLSEYKKFVCTIYDRWGAKVYAWDNNTTTGGWNGQTNKGTVTSGVYYYLLDATTKNEKEKKLNGFLQLLKD